MHENKKQLLWRLFYVFFKIGLFTFGGGYAMLPLIQREVVENNKWIDEDTLMDVFAISESTPGPVAINSATFIGYNIMGFWGSLCATFGVVLPSVIVIVAISGFYVTFRSNVWVDYAFRGVQAAVCVLLINNVIKLVKKYKKNSFALVTALISFILMAVFNVKAIYIIITCMILGIISVRFNISLKEDDDK